jgi:hypothetical protein
MNIITTPARRPALLNAVAALTLLGMAACTSHTWAPPPGGSPVSYDQQAAQCRLFARGITPSGGFVAAAGRPAFVGAFVGSAVLAQSIAGAVATQNNFNDCMFASGWVAVDQQPAATPIRGERLPGGALTDAVLAAPATNEAATLRINR